MKILKNLITVIKPEERFFCKKYCFILFYLIIYIIKLIKLIFGSHFGVDDLPLVGFLIVLDVVLGNWGVDGMNRDVQVINNRIDLFSRTPDHLVVSETNLLEGCTSDPFLQNEC